MEQENIITEHKIFELYGDYILNHGERPKAFTASQKTMSSKKKTSTITFQALNR